MVLPKDLRDKAKIQPGDKFVAISWEKGGVICCFWQNKADSLAEEIRDLLDPMIQDLSKVESK